MEILTSTIEKSREGTNSIPPVWGHWSSQKRLLKKIMMRLTRIRKMSKRWRAEGVAVDITYIPLFHIYCTIREE
jgi:hypothetical protein